MGGPQPAQSPPCNTTVTAHPSTASVPINILLYNGLLCGFNVPIKWLIQCMESGWIFSLWYQMWRLWCSVWDVVLWYYWQVSAAYNQISDMSPVSLLSSVTVLNLSNNDITSIKCMYHAHLLCASTRHVTEPAEIRFRRIGILHLTSTRSRMWMQIYHANYLHTVLPN